MSKFKSLHLVVVDWVDSAAHNGWRDWKEAAETQDTIQCRSVGFLLSKDKGRVALAGSITNNDDAGERHSIPKSCVIKMRSIEKFLQEEKERRPKAKE